MTIAPRIRGILYVVLVVAGIVTGVSQALAPDVAAEAAPVAGGWIDTVLAIVAVVAGVLARLNLTPAAPTPLDPAYVPPAETWPVRTELEAVADLEAAENDPAIWPYVTD